VLQSSPLEVVCFLPMDWRGKFMFTSNWSLCAFAFLAVSASGCGNNAGPGSIPTSPTPSTGGTASVTIAIVTTGGSNSFSPNPAAEAQGGTVAWRNADNTTHRIVADDGSFDTGNIAAGATSQAVMASAAGVNYHCSIHPAMVGTISAQ